MECIEDRHRNNPLPNYRGRCKRERVTCSQFLHSWGRNNGQSHLPTVTLAYQISYPEARYVIWKRIETGRSLLDLSIQTILEEFSIASFCHWFCLIPRWIARSFLFQTACGSFWSGRVRRPSNPVWYPSSYYHRNKATSPPIPFSRCQSPRTLMICAWFSASLVQSYRKDVSFWTWIPVISSKTFSLWTLDA